MKTNCLLLKTMLAVFVVCLSAYPASAQFDELAGRLPTSTNLVVMIDATEMFDSQIAKEQGWSENRQNRFAAGLTAIPPKADKVVIATHMDWEFMRPGTQAEIVQFNSPPEMKEIAEAYGGKVDSISKHPAVALPSDCYIIQLSEDTFGVMNPANRQVVSRWIQQENAALSSYLKEAVAYQDKTSDIIIAFDLYDAISLSAVQQKLETSDAEALKKLTLQDKRDLADVLATIKGVMLGINFGTKANGAIRVDFGRDAKLLEKIGKPLLLHVLGKHGIMIDELENWEPSVEGNTFSMRGTLTYSGLTRIGSLIDPPTELSTAGRSQAASHQSTESKSEGQVTKEYFDSLKKLSGDLKRQKRDAANYPQIGYFYGKYGQKIAQLPILNVDPEMVKYADYVSGQLQSVSNVFKGVGIRTGPEQMRAADSQGGNYSYSGSIGGYEGRYNGAYGVSWSGVGYSAKLEQQRRTDARIQVAQKNRAQGNLSVEQIMSQIETATLTIRRAMTEKYQIEF